MIRYIMEQVNLGSGQGQVTDIEMVDISVFRMKNNEENTPLHEALINGNHLEAKYLIKADPSVSFSAKTEKKRTTPPPPPPPPRYLAASVEGKSPLHAATFGQKEDIYLSLLGYLLACCDFRPIG
ncbi:hypothetical protein ACLB2K_042705 [Fragaria x ananassa]